ncbi:MAG: hypothetical protein U0T83_08900 [Bacteriovoracaceae bacterium]
MKKLRNELIILFCLLLTFNVFAKNSISNSIDTSEISISTITDITKLGGNITLDYINHNKDISGIISMVIGGGVMIVGSVAALPVALSGGFFIAVVGIDYFKQYKDEKVKIILIDSNVDFSDIDLFKEEINEINKCYVDNRLNKCSIIEDIKHEFDAEKLPKSNRNVLELLKICYERMLLIIKQDGDLSRVSNIMEIIESNAKAAQAEYALKIANQEVVDTEAEKNNNYKDFFEDKLYALLVNTKVLLN